MVKVFVYQTLVSQLFCFRISHTQQILSNKGVTKLLFAVSREFTTTALTLSEQQTNGGG